MRSNGLTASAYTPIADVDPRIVGPLLADLKQHGVAAYVTPVESTSMGAFERPEFRTEVRDRLYVDADSADTAKHLIAVLDGEVETTGEDLAWAQIVSGYDRPGDGDAPWPVTEELSTSEPAEASAGHDDPRPDPEPVKHKDLAPADDAFVPPPPPPLPRLEPRKQVAWVAVVGGPLLLLLAVLVGLHLPGWLAAMAVGGFVGGFIALVVMMGAGGDDADSDDGAVV